MEPLFEKVQYLKGVGPKRSDSLARIGVNSVFDLFWHIPRDYFDQATVKTIAELAPAEKASILGEVMAVDKRGTRGRSVLRALVQDHSGSLPAVWFNQAFLSRVVKPGVRIFLTGRSSSYGGRREFYVSDYEILEDGNQAMRILPIYPLTEGLSQKTMRSTLNLALQEKLQYYPEVFDREIRERLNLCDAAYALYNIHFPSSMEAAARARRRLALEELFIFHYRLYKQRRSNNGLGTTLLARGNLTDMVLKALPFQLTAAQKRVLQEIIVDLESPHPMNRLLQGDVGSGKTIVAALAMAHAVDSGYQATIMAPTELLAQQHFQALQQYLGPQGIAIGSITGSCGAAERRAVLQGAAQGGLDIVVGTHALLQKEVKFARLGLIVIDEQHRFGVRQRAGLSAKGSNPDLLVMSATPIPRTLSLTLYGDLDLTTIDEMPPGRKEVKTILVPERRRGDLYQHLHDVLLSDARLQAYIVCPLVDGSEVQDLRAAEALYAELESGIFRDVPVGMVHGRLKASQKEKVMDDFKHSRIKALIATTVIEVGVDVPAASYMVVEHADRFGLSQLHQLRGRVGRGYRQSYCYLLAEPRTEEAWRRLMIMEQSTDGFHLAREDLKLRGPGEVWGLKQHGIKPFKVASLLEDQELMEISLELVKKLRGENPKIEEYINRKQVAAGEIAFN